MLKLNYALFAHVNLPLNANLTYWSGPALRIWNQSIMVVCGVRSFWFRLLDSSKMRKLLGTLNLVYL